MIAESAKVMNVGFPGCVQSHVLLVPENTGMQSRRLLDLGVETRYCGEKHHEGGPSGMRLTQLVLTMITNVEGLAEMK